MPLPPELHSNWSALSQLLDEALALPPASRTAFVDSLSGERKSLRDTLRQLLGQADGVETSDFMTTLPQFTQTVTGGALNELACGDTIGPYRLLHELGTGGMGSVWLAERADGTLKRKVALKLPRLTWAKGLAERMARERDILASLEHPYIARLYDAGLDQMGRPYLALEYVEGQPIDVYARERKLSVRQKLDLLLQVCAAVAFAHSRLVVHRDLKPSNIMVTADGQVRLLDFGIAKLIEGDTGNETQLTQLAGRALTLDYASPEQIKSESIGTASDVYSLGVVAYELLTGAKPYRLKRGSAAELEEAIVTAAPTRPSEAVGSRSIGRQLRGDLDSILNKALKKIPADRYGTVEGLADDLRNHLTAKPVTARPDSLLYRTRKFVTRYAVQVSATVAVLLTLAAALTLTLHQAQEAQRQRDRALVAATNADASAARAEEEAQKARMQARRADEQSRAAELASTAARDAAERERLAGDRARFGEARATEEAARAGAIKEVLLKIFSAGETTVGGRPMDQLRLKDVIDSAKPTIDKHFARYPDTEEEVALILGDLYRDIDAPAQAFEWYQRSLAAQARRSPPAPPQDRLDLYSRLAQSAFFLGDMKALGRTLDAFELELKQAGPVGGRFEPRALLLRARWWIREGREMAAALQMLQKASLLFAYYEPAHPMRLYTEQALTQVTAFAGMNVAALAHADAAVYLSSLRRDQGARPDRADAFSVRGRLRLETGNAGGALVDLREARDLYYEIQGAKAFTSAQNDALLARALVATTAVQEGLALAEQASRNVAASRPGSPSLAQVLEWQALALIAANQPLEALAVLDQAADLRNKLPGGPRALASTDLLRARAARLAGDTAAAQKFLQSLIVAREDRAYAEHIERQLQDERYAQGR